MSKDDVLLNDDVVEELKDDPAVDPSRIAIAVDDGVVTMSGSVPTYWQKVEAERVVRRGVARTRTVGSPSWRYPACWLDRPSHTTRQRSRGGAPPNFHEDRDKSPVLWRKLKV
jgi:BON domain